MIKKIYLSYEAAVSDYLGQFNMLLQAPAKTQEAAVRGASDPSTVALIERADAIADLSAGMIPLAADYLDAPDPALREGISAHLLAQAAAEMQVATELLQIAAAEMPGAAAFTVRSGQLEARGDLRDAIASMEQVVGVPLAASFTTSQVMARGTAVTDPDQAKQALQQAATVTTNTISQQVVKVGGDLAFNLVFKTQWAAVIGSAGMLNKDIAKLLESAKEGANALAQRALTVASKTILNVFDKILALLGKDGEDLARKQIRTWLDDIQESGKIELFEQLVGKLYQVDALTAALPNWLAATKAEVALLNTTTTQVTALSGKFDVLMGQLNTVSDVIGWTKFLEPQIPQLLAVCTALRVSLLAVLVYAGYDYIGYEQVAFLNLTQGVGETIRANLGVASVVG